MSSTIHLSPGLPRLRLGFDIISRLPALCLCRAPNNCRPACLSPLMDLYEARGDGVAIDHTASGGGVLRLSAPHPRALDIVLLLSRRIAALSSRLCNPPALSADPFF